MSQSIRVERHRAAWARGGESINTGGTEYVVSIGNETDGEIDSNINRLEATRSPSPSSAFHFPTRDKPALALHGRDQEFIQMLDSDKYDAVVLGTGIASSITAA